jgi:hypothetical protein
MRTPLYGDDASQDTLHPYLLRKKRIFCWVGVLALVERWTKT